MNKINSASAIILSEGSAIHTLELCDVRESSVFIICRRSRQSVEHLFVNMLSRKGCKVGISGEGSAVTPLDWEPTRNTPAWQNASAYLDLSQIINDINKFLGLAIETPDKEIVQESVKQSIVDIILDPRSTRKSTTDEQLGALLRLLRTQIPTLIPGRSL